MSRNIVTINSPVWNDYNHDVITFILSQFLLHNTSVKNNSWMFSFFVKRIMFKRQFTHAGKRDTNWFLSSFAVSLKRPRISKKVFFLSVFQKEHSLTKSSFPDLSMGVLQHVRELQGGVRDIWNIMVLVLHLHKRRIIFSVLSETNLSSKCPFLTSGLTSG